MFLRFSMYDGHAVSLFESPLVSIMLTGGLTEPHMTSLSDKQRPYLLQYYIMGYTYRKIAEMEGVTDTAVKQNINKIIKKLKKFLK